MKLQQVKNAIAKKYGYESFEDFDDRSTFGYNHDTPKIIDEIAEEYHRLMSIDECKLNLKDLSNKLDKALESETKESLNKWLSEIRKNCTCN